MALILTVQGNHPVIPGSCFIAPNATVTGDVVFGEQCSVWFQAVVRGDVHRIRIGNRVNLQDHAMVHCTWKKAGVVVGDDVTVGHRAILHGCTVEGRVLIGMGAIVMDNCVIGSDSVIAAGAVLTEGTVVPPGSLYAGVPAKWIRALDRAEWSETLQRMAAGYVNYAGWYR